MTDAWTTVRVETRGNDPGPDEDIGGDIRYRGDIN